MIYVIRFLQILICSVAPSAISTYAIIRQPSVPLWIALCAVSFVIFLALNAVFNAMIYRAVRGIIPEYFKINITVYIAYIVFTVIVYNFTDATVFSFLCACLRAFEELVEKTRYTVALSHIIAVFFMVIQPYIMRKHDEKIARMRAEQESLLDEEVGLMIDTEDDGIAPDDPFRNEDMM